MVLSAEIKELLQRNAATEPEAVRARNSQAMRLQLPTKTITLVNASGKATEAGKYFYQKIRRQPIPDAKFDDDAVTYRKDGGRTDFVRLRSGAEVRLRTWNPASGKFDYSEMGKHSSTRGGLRPISCRCGLGAGTARGNLIWPTFQPRI